MDTYAEFIVKKKKDVKDYLVYVGACVLAFVCSFVVLSIPQLAPYVSILCWFLIGIGYGAYRIITSRNIEFEYIVTNGELDVDKIINKKRRKRILTVDTKSFETFEPVNESILSRIKTINPITVIHAEGDISSPDTYVAIFNKNGVKNCLFIQPNERVLEAISRRRR